MLHSGVFAASWYVLDPRSAHHQAHVRTVLEYALEMSRAFPLSQLHSTLSSSKCWLLMSCLLWNGQTQPDGISGSLSHHRLSFASYLPNTQQALLEL